MILAGRAYRLYLDHPTLDRAARAMGHLITLELVPEPPASVPTDIEPARKGRRLILAEDVPASLTP